MTDPDALPTATEAIGEIADPSMEEASRAADHALGDDDTAWLRTVLTSLQGRSLSVKEALEKAVVDGQLCGNPAGLTTLFQSPENLGLPSGKRSQTSVVYTIRPHNHDDGGGSNPEELSLISRVDQGAKRVDLIE